MVRFTSNVNEKNMECIKEQHVTNERPTEKHIYSKTGLQTSRQMDRQAGRQMDRQADRQTDGWTGEQTVRRIVTQTDR